jgi:Domain of unknown function (DUF4412)
MRQVVILFLLLATCAGCTGRDGATKVDVIVRRAITLGNSAAAEAGFLYWGARTRISDGPSTRVIFDLDAKTVTFIDKSHRTYIVRTFDEVVRKYEAQQAHRDANAVTISLAATGKKERIAGLEAREYTFATAVAHGTVWVTDQVRPPTEWRKWESLVGSYESGMAGGKSVTDAVAGVNGYPLRTTFTFGEGDAAWTIVMQVSEIVPASPTDELTSIPPGYQRANDFPISGES